MKPFNKSPIRNISMCILMAASVLLSNSCHRSIKKQQNEPNNDTLALTIRFQPAFIEHGAVLLFKTDSNSFIQLLLRNYIGADQSQDTFWFKKIQLNEAQFASINSTLVSLCRQKISQQPALKETDGINISSTLIQLGDTSFFSMRNPRYEVDSAAYRVAFQLVEMIPSIFNDTLVTEYFSELQEYLDDRKNHQADSTRPIDRLRMKKYQWEIDKPK